MLGIMFKNMLGYDALIVLAGFINGLLFMRILKGLKQIDEDFKITQYLQNDWLVKVVSPDDETQSAKALREILDKFTKNKQNLDRTSVFYISLTSIFPLLGILGTVISLLTLGDFSSQMASINFSHALTSTFWGIVFAIISKFGEGFFTSKIEMYDKLYHEIRSNLIATGDGCD